MVFFSLKKFSRFKNIDDERTMLKNISYKNVHFKGGTLDSHYQKKYRRDSAGKRIKNVLRNMAA